jgi:hypothetical protein
MTEKNSVTERFILIAHYDGKITRCLKKLFDGRQIATRTNHFFDDALQTLKKKKERIRLAIFCQVLPFDYSASVAQKLWEKKKMRGKELPPKTPMLVTKEQIEDWIKLEKNHPPIIFMPAKLRIDEPWWILENKQFKHFPFTWRGGNLDRTILEKLVQIIGNFLEKGAANEQRVSHNATIGQGQSEPPTG